MEKAKLPLSVDTLTDDPWSELTTHCTFLKVQHSAVEFAKALNIPVM
jgi:hypothetical protein